MQQNVPCRRAARLASALGTISLPAPAPGSTSIFGLAGIAVLTAPVCTAAPSGMVAWYPGDGNARDTQGGNNGTLYNGAAFAAGKVSQAFSFDGQDDNVRVAHNPSLNPTAAISIDAWIYPTAFGNFRFFVIVEALPNPPPGPASEQQPAPAAASLDNVKRPGALRSKGGPGRGAGTNKVRQ